MGFSWCVYRMASSYEDGRVTHLAKRTSATLLLSGPFITVQESVLRPGLLVNFDYMTVVSSIPLLRALLRGKMADRTNGVGKAV